MLNTDFGIFFEFVPAQEIFSENPFRLSLRDVKAGENYALIINSNAGLWGYNLGDIVKFVSINPWRIVVAGRIKHFISAFGEHVIGEEVEYSLLKAAEREGVKITEFTVAPMIAQDRGKSYHEWFVEFEHTPQSIHDFSLAVDRNLREKNIYYDDLYQRQYPPNAKNSAGEKEWFYRLYEKRGQTRRQNKVPV